MNNGRLDPQAGMPSGYNNHLQIAHNFSNSGLQLAPNSEIYPSVDVVNGFLSYPDIAKSHRLRRVV